MSKALVPVLGFVVVLSLMSGCVPTLTYKLNPVSPSSPADDELIFGLRTSVVLLTSPAQKPIKLGDPSPSPASPVEDVCSPLGADSASRDAISRCLETVTALAIPIRDEQHLFSATPNWGTTVTVTAVDADPLMLKTLSVNYKNPGVGVVKAAGAGAVTGFAIGGPYGALAGGAIGALSTLPMGGSVPLNEEGLAGWKTKLCANDRKTFEASEAVAPAEKVAQLFLPAALEYGSNPADFECWRLMPNARPQDLGLTGWVYRFQPIDQDESKSLMPPIVTPEWDTQHGDKRLRTPFVRREDYFTEGREKTTFPISACRRVEVQIAWWEGLKNQTMKISKYKVVVADSDYVQPVRLPKSGQVTLLATCGGYSTSTISSLPSTELIDEVVKQAQAVKEAQNKNKAR
ncbi:MAG: hypothetical protein K2X00_01605 [Nitrospiraceae bacterium]|nr:hypothetical protein [Nitrospiraceae bacterium]